MSSKNTAIHYRLLDWASALDPVESVSLESLVDDTIRPDLILGADLVNTFLFLSDTNLTCVHQVFDPSLVPALVATLLITLRKHHAKETAALISLTVRNEATLAGFLEHASDYRLLLAICSLTHGIP